MTSTDHPIIRLGLMVVFTLSLVSCASTATRVPAKLIVNATLISPERDAPLADAWVRVEGDRITAVGSGAVDRAGAEVIDAEGGYLIPGLIDSHVHIYHATGLKRRYTENFEALRAAFMAQQPRSFVYHGFTTVIELNADAESNAHFESAPVHPRLFHCSQGVILSDGFMALDIPKGEIESTYPGYLIDNHAGGRIPAGADPLLHTPQAAVERVRRHGGRCVKLYYEEALWWPDEERPEFRLPSAAIVRDVVAAAHASNLPVVLHATTPAGHRLALDTGIDILAHGMWEWPGQPFDAPEPSAEYAAIARTVATSTIGLQPTVRTIRNTASMFDPAVLDDPAWRDVVPPEYLQYLRGDGQKQRDLFLKMFGPLLQEAGDEKDVAKLQAAFSARYERLIGRMASDGAHLLFGTDTAVGGFGWGSPPGLAGYWEMESWARSGVPLRTLLQALTLDNARAFHLQDEIGSIQPGKLADLLILRANPLESVSAYQQIDRVILGGKVADRDSLSAQRPETGSSAGSSRRSRGQ